MAASLHLESAIPNFIIHEHHTYAIKDFNRELCIQDIQLINGYFEAPNTPGLSIEINEKALSRKINKIVVKIRFIYNFLLVF